MNVLGLGWFGDEGTLVIFIGFVFSNLWLTSPRVTNIAGSPTLLILQIFVAGKKVALHFLFIPVHRHTFLGFLSNKYQVS